MNCHCSKPKTEHRAAAGTTAIRLSRPWKLNRWLHLDSTCYGETSEHTSKSHGGRRRCGHGDGPRRWNTGDVARGEAAHLWLGWLSENVAEVREVLVELWLEWCWLWCSSELARAQRSSTASLRLVLSAASVNASRARQGNANEGGACSRGRMGLMWP